MEWATFPSWPLALVLFAGTAYPLGKEAKDDPSVRAGVPGLSDYLYVVDSAGGSLSGQILVLDVSSGKIVRIFPGGYKPDAVLSPDGSRLYVMSRGEGFHESLIVTYSTASGEAVEFADNPDIVETPSDYSTHFMTMAPSGKWIYVWKDRRTLGVDDVYMAVFDVEHNQFLPNHISLGGNECFSARFLPTNRELTVDVVCSTSVTELTIRPHGSYDKALLLSLAESLSMDDEFAAPVMIAPDGSSGKIVMRSLSEEARLGFAAGALSANGGLFLLTRSGQASGWSRGTGVQRGMELLTHRERWISGQPLLSGDGRSYYVATSLRSSPTGLADEIVRIDAASRTSNVEPNIQTPFHFALFSHDRSTIYTISPAAVITAIDSASMRFLGSIKPIGQTPSFALAALRPTMH